jgi:hypothetical protein
MDINVALWNLADLFDTTHEPMSPSFTRHNLQYMEVP